MKFDYITLTVILPAGKTVEKVININHLVSFNTWNEESTSVILSNMHNGDMYLVKESVEEIKEKFFNIPNFI